MFVTRDRFYLTTVEFNGFIKKSFYRCKYQAPKSYEIEQIVGMDKESFIDYLENTFMSRYGVSTQKYYEHFSRHLLVIDHIVSLRTAKSADDVRKLCHYTNLQLLTHRDNIIKEKGTNIDICHSDVKRELEYYDNIKKVRELDCLLKDARCAETQSK